MARKPFRGVSVGTMFTLCLTLLAVVMSAFVYARISGEPGELAAGVISMSAKQETPTFAPTQTPQAALTPTPPAQETKRPEKTLRLAAAGQVQMGTEMRSGARQDDGSYAFPDAFSRISYLLRGDINLASLHAMLAEDLADYGNYNAPDEISAYLKSAGINLLNIGTDRILDLGMEGLAATRAVLKENELASVGAYTALSEAENGTLLDCGGVRVGIVSFVQELSAAGEKSSSETERIYATRDLQQTIADMAALKQRGAEVIIAMAWWGNHGQEQVSEDMRAIARELAQGGADVVLGDNPSRALPFERIQQENGRETFVAYSLGNLLSDESRQTQDIVGMILNLELKVEESGVVITRAEYTPTWIMRYRNANGAYQYCAVPAGSSQMPMEMTESVYANMQRAYVNLVDRIGTQEASPAAE